LAISINFLKVQIRVVKPPGKISSLHGCSCRIRPFHFQQVCMRRTGNRPFHVVAQGGQLFYRWAGPLGPPLALVLHFPMSPGHIDISRKPHTPYRLLYLARKVIRQSINIPKHANCFSTPNNTFASVQTDLVGINSSSPDWALIALLRSL